MTSPGWLGEPMIRFDPSISLGTLVGLASLLITIFIGFSRLSARFTAIETKLDIIWGWWKRHMETTARETPEEQPRYTSFPPS